MQTKNKKVYLYTLGCKVNQYETEAMTEMFREAGYGIANAPAGADIYVVNSCTVTANSDQKTRQAVRRFKRMNPNSCVVLTGCMSQVYYDEAINLHEADIVTGNTDHRHIIELVNDFITAQKDSKTNTPCRITNQGIHNPNEVFEDLLITNFTGRTRAFIKIQDGCDRYCSYCIIPTARGRSRSRSIDSISIELDKLFSAGFKEVVLVGINFCCYGTDINKTFTDAIELACSKGFERVRIGSLEFDNISDSAIDRLAKLPNFCPQFHISIQSGCDKTLRAMNRHYNTTEYEMLCNKLRSKFPEASITTDMMVGFPGETAEDFEESIKFAKRIGFEKMHVFPYSARPGTKAATMPQIDGTTKSERAKIMLTVADGLRAEFLKSQIGKTVEVLTETFDMKTGMFTGYTKNYTPVSFKLANIGVDSSISIVSALSNKLVTVKITGVDSSDDCCTGELV